MTKFLLTALLFLIVICGQAQTDTVIDNRKYKIISRHSNGKVRQVGQFANDCRGNTHKKHGDFLTFNKSGVQTKKEIYFYDKKHNRKILGLKHGWWGFYGSQTKYFMGIKRFTVITDPCF